MAGAARGRGVRRGQLITCRETGVHAAGSQVPVCQYSIIYLDLYTNFTISRALAFGLKNIYKKLLVSVKSQRKLTHNHDR